MDSLDSELKGESSPRNDDVFCELPLSFPLEMGDEAELASGGGVTIKDADLLEVGSVVLSLFPVSGHWGVGVLGLDEVEVVGGRGVGEMGEDFGVNNSLGNCVTSVIEPPGIVASEILADNLVKVFKQFSQISSCREDDSFARTSRDSGHEDISAFKGVKTPSSFKVHDKASSGLKFANAFCSWFFLVVDVKA